MRVFVVVALAACTKPSPAPRSPERPPPELPAPPGEAAELTVYRSRADLPPELAPVVPDDFDFAHFELAAPDHTAPDAHYVITPPSTAPSARAGGRLIVEEQVHTCGQGRTPPTYPPSTEPPPPIPLWQLSRDDGRVWLVSRRVETRCAP